MSGGQMQGSAKPKRLVVAVTGASGAIYAVRLLQRVAPLAERVDIVLSETAPAVFATEMGAVLRRPFDSVGYLGADFPSVRFLAPKDYYTPPASGSYQHDGMVIVPCSMGTLGRIACCSSDDLICRAADVTLKERRPLILVARETPLNLIHLRNMVTVTEAGAVVLPAAPAFYHNPKTIDDLVDTVIARVLQLLGIPQDIMPQWADG
jgi:4-hydroxy-3-polyprenylbenzoate decarboxylase